MFCGQCGTKNEEGSKFCESCGARLVMPRHKSVDNPGRILHSRTYDDSEETLHDGAYGDSERALNDRAMHDRAHDYPGGLCMTELMIVLIFLQGILIMHTKAGVLRKRRSVSCS